MAIKKRRKATKTKRTISAAGSGEQVKGKKKGTVRRKFDKGGRIEAYTFGEALDSKKWP